MKKKVMSVFAKGLEVHEPQHSMKRRSPWHDYQRKGSYMLTLVVEGHHIYIGIYPFSLHTYSGAYPFSIPGMQSSVRRVKTGSF